MCRELHRSAGFSTWISTIVRVFEVRSGPVRLKSQHPAHNGSIALDGRSLEVRVQATQTA
jgi:hypothetical protein